MSALYRIQDEPRPGRLAHFTVNPTFPLLAMMLAGSWVGLPWFVLNGFALGSVTRRRELGLALVVIPGTLLLTFLLALLRARGILPERALPYAQVGITVWKLALGYVLFDLQQRSFALHEYSGGPVRNGALVLVAAILLTTSVLVRFAGKNPLLWLLLN